MELSSQNLHIKSISHPDFNANCNYLAFDNSKSIFDFFFDSDSSMSLQECPSGVVNEDTFKQIYAQFFPHGGSVERVACVSVVLLFGWSVNVFFYLLQMPVHTHTTCSMPLTQHIQDR